MIDLYTNIKKERIAQGMSQEELAHKVGYADKGMISRIENGKVDLPQSKIVEFADVLGVTPGQLMGWEETIRITKDSIATFKEQLEKSPKETINKILFNNNEILIEVSEKTNRAMKLYESYEKADPNIKAAIDSLLRGNASDSNSNP